MHDFDLIQKRLQATALANNAAPVIEVARAAMQQVRHGDLARWRQAVQSLPLIEGVRADLDQDCVSVATAAQQSDATRRQIRAALRLLCPWRKGPYSILGTHIDTEWRSDWKWQRIAPHLSSLAGRRVLDVGCGNGYHVWRMAGADAGVVVGIDPSLLFNMQFSALQHFIQHSATAVLPLKLEQLPPLACFDTVFSMGVLYHRRQPEAHLQELWQAMAPGAELILETLVMPPDGPALLKPQERYARMRNVWQIPNTETLCKWLEKCGFSEINVVSEAFTSCAEQRSTEWMQFESLAQSLDPQAHNLTVEGYPAPRRAVLIARGPVSSS